jgi:hypothetical protein
MSRSINLGRVNPRLTAFAYTDQELQKDQSVPTLFGGESVAEIMREVRKRNRRQPYPFTAVNFSDGSTCVLNDQGEFEFETLFDATAGKVWVC